METTGSLGIDGLFQNDNPFCLGNTKEYAGNSLDSSESYEEETWRDRVSISQQARLIDNFFNLREEGRGLYKAIFSYLRNRYGASVEDIEDVMTEAQIKAWQSRNKFDLSKKARPWLYSIATNACIDYQRRNKRHRRMTRLNDIDINKVGDENEECCYGDILEGHPERTAEDNEESEIVKNSLSMLSPKSRQVIELVYFQGLRYKEAAEVLKIPTGTVKTRLFYAKRDLRKKISRYNSS